MFSTFVVLFYILVNETKEWTEEEIIEEESMLFKIFLKFRIWIFTCNEDDLEDDEDFLYEEI